MQLTATPADEKVIGDSVAPSVIALDAVHFAELMAKCGPFEAGPHLAVGVSGGADSLALMLLMANWVRGLGGRLTALTVDHGLRVESANEAKAVAIWAAEAGIESRTLPWSGAKPVSGLQGAARRARYDLLTAWCRDAGVLHLAVAHHQDDQRETIAMRRARSEEDGVGNAGMSLIAARDGVRLLRPLLPVPAECLKAYLHARGQAWIDDPSNQLTRFERIRWRLGLEGPLPEPAEIQAWGRQRIELEEAVANLLVRSVTIHEAGFALIDLTAWRRAMPNVVSLALGRLVAMVGGLDYLPARTALWRAAEALLAGAPGQALGGTLISIWRGQGLICREAAAAMGETSLAGPTEFLWDRRFLVSVPEPGTIVRIGALGDAGLAEIGQSRLIRLKNRDIPPSARAALPALRDATGRLIAVPHLEFDPYQQASNANFQFRPHYSATSGGFTVAYGWQHTI